MTINTTDEYRYEKLSWPEIDTAAQAGKMIVVPVGSTEDHGYHLPLDVDQVLPGTICEETVRERDDCLLFQTVQHGYLPHHMDYPGGITLRWDTFVNYLIDIGVSLAHHGFKKILFVNGHGSNRHLAELATRQIVIQYPEVHAALLSWFEMEEIHDVLQDISDGGSEGSAHAGELETSVYLARHPEYVNMEEATRDLSFPESKHFYRDSELYTGESREGGSTPVTMMEWWSTISETGVWGDGTVASAEKGEQFIEAGVRGLHSILNDFADYPHREIEDKHARDVADNEYDPFRPR